MTTKTLNYKVILGVFFSTILFLLIFSGNSSAEHLIDWKASELDTFDTFSIIGWDEREGVSGYRLWVYDVVGREFVKAEDIRILDGERRLFRNIAISGLEPDNMYRAILVEYAVNDEGEREWGSFSNWIYIKTKKQPVPTAFAMLYLRYYKNANIIIDWGVVEGADGYEVQVSDVDEEGYYDIAKLTSGNISTVSIDSLRRGKSYYFRTRATSIAGIDSDWSEPILAKT